MTSTHHLHHTNSPSTAIEAAEHVVKSGTREKHHAVILAAYKGVLPMSSQEIADSCTLSYHQVARRINELIEAGKIVEAGYTLNVSGRKARRYELKSRGDGGCNF